MHTYPTGIRIKPVFIRWLKLTLVRESSLKPHTLDEGSRLSVRTGSTQTEPAGSFGDQRVSDKQDVKNPSSLVLTPSGQSPYYTRDGVTTKHDLCDHIALDNRELLIQALKRPSPTGANNSYRLTIQLSVHL